MKDKFINLVSNLDESIVKFREKIVKKDLERKIKEHKKNFQEAPSEQDILEYKKEIVMRKAIFLFLLVFGTILLVRFSN